MATIVLEEKDHGKHIELVDKTTNQGLKKVVVGVGWTPDPAHSKEAVDVDLSAVARDKNGDVLLVNGNPREPNMVYYARQDQGWGKALKGDDQSGSGGVDDSSDDEEIAIEFSKLPADASFVDVPLTIYQAKDKGQYFGQVPCSFRVYDGEGFVEGTTKPLWSFNTKAGEVFGETGFHALRFVRQQDGTWTFIVPTKKVASSYATLSGFAGATIA